MEGFQETHLTVSVETNNSFYSVKNYLLILLKNLITNSIKFRNKDKECTVNISVQINAKEATIIIKDNGLGIEQKHLDNIFKVFYKVANNPGGGLGLFMVDKIIEKLQGKINVESKVGVGTTFTISVPNTMENRVKDLQSLEMK
jgi:signal transduction histidine kinase